MLSLFRTNQLLGGALYVFYLLLLRGLSLILPEYFTWEIQSSGFLSFPVLEWLDTQTYWIEEVLSFGLLLFQAMFITLSLRRHRLLSEDLLIPGALYLLVVNALPAFHEVSPMLLANTFLLIGVDQLITTYRNQNCADHLFNVGLAVAIASFFHFSYLTFLLLGFLGLGSLRLFRLREFLMIWSGAVVAYFLAGVYWFWMDGLEHFLQVQFLDNITFFSFVRTLSNVDVYVSLALMTFFTASAIVGYSSLMRKQGLPFQKRIGIYYFVLFLTPTILLFQANLDLSNLLILSIPVGVTLGLILKSMNKTSAEIFHLFLLSIVILWQLKPLLLR
ncbi:MAG: hypothetical protein AAF738_07765 [Bacteroidota bacterium]